MADLTDLQSAATTKIIGSDSLGIETNPLAVDADGDLRVSVKVVGTAVSIADTGTVPSGQTVYKEYTVPVGKILTLQNFYSGGLAVQGNAGPLRAAMFGHDDATATIIPNGDFENSGQVAAWAAVTGNFTAPSPDSSSTQFQTGAASMRWIYTNSATALVRRQTFSPAVDMSNYRYIRVKFFNDAATGTTRTISIVLTSGTSTRTYSIGPIALGSSPFIANTWITLVADIENPTSFTGTTFDSFNINSVDLSMKDANNKSGTVYWDSVQLFDALTPLHRLYSPDGTTISIALAPAPYAAGYKIYIRTKNTASGTLEYSTVANGILEDA